MKKFLSLIFATLIMFSVANCGGGNKTNKAAGDTNAAEVLDDSAVADTNATDVIETVAPTEEEKAEAATADKDTKAAVDDLADEDSGAEVGLD